jgi:hypothetical protein
VRWLPLDIAAEAAIRLSTHDAFAPDPGSPAFYHLEAAKGTDWSRIAGAISSHPLTQTCTSASSLQFVSGEEWLDSVANGKENAARRLLPFFREMIEQKIVPHALDTTKLSALVGGLLDFEMDVNLLQLYVIYACK